jgi:hypothetical protein
MLNRTTSKKHLQTCMNKITIVKRGDLLENWAEILLGFSRFLMKRDLQHQSFYAYLNDREARQHSH